MVPVYRDPPPPPPATEICNIRHNINETCGERVGMRGGSHRTSYYHQIDRFTDTSTDLHGTARQRKYTR